MPYVDVRGICDALAPWPGAVLAVALVVFLDSPRVVERARRLVRLQDLEDLVRDLADADPLYYSGITHAWHCSLCGMGGVAGEAQEGLPRRDTCPWERAVALTT